MENFDIVGREQACIVAGGRSQEVGRFIRLLGRLIGRIARAVYDLFDGKGEPQASGVF